MESKVDLEQPQIIFTQPEANTIDEHWQNMPEYNNVQQPEPFITATFKFQNQEDYDEFHAKIKKYLYNGEKVFDGMQKKDKKQTWYPLKEKARNYEFI